MGAREIGPRFRSALNPPFLHVTIIDNSPTPMYTFDDFTRSIPNRSPQRIPTLDALQPGDTQVLFPQSATLDALDTFPAIQSVVTRAQVHATRDLPQIRELLLSSSGRIPSPATLRHLTGLDTLFAARSGTPPRLDLASLPGPQMRKLAVNRWMTVSLEPLHQMPGLTHLYLDLFRDPLDAVSEMSALTYLSVKGPAKGWANLRECTQLEEAHLIQVQIANLRRWNTWQRLHTLALAGTGIKSLQGLEASQNLRHLTLINMTIRDLSPIRDLPQLEALNLRMASEQVDLESITKAAKLRTFVIDSSARDSRAVHLSTLQPVSRLEALEEIVLRETVIDDGDLIPLAALPHLRRVHLGSDITADVDKLRAARPDLEINYTPPNPKWEALKERIGHVTLQKPGEGLKQWSIFQSLAQELNLPTNYAAESRIKREIKQRDPTLSKRLDWDTEAGNVGIYADQEEDIRTVAEIINRLIDPDAAPQGMFQ